MEEHRNIRHGGTQGIQTWRDTGNSDIGITGDSDMEEHRGFRHREHRGFRHREHRGFRHGGTQGCMREYRVWEGTRGMRRNTGYLREHLESEGSHGHLRVHRTVRRSTEA